MHQLRVGFVWKTMQWFLWTFALLNIGYWARSSFKAKLSQTRAMSKRSI